VAATSQGKGNVYKLKRRNVYKLKGRSVYKLKGRNVYKLKGRNVYKLKGRIECKPDPWPLLCPLSSTTLAARPLKRTLPGGNNAKW